MVATLTEQVLQKGFRVVIASPDKDFKQLISEDVQIVMPIPELDRWSYYTLKHYVAQYGCNPCSDLSLSKFYNFQIMYVMSNFILDNLTMLDIYCIMNRYFPGHSRLFNIKVTTTIQRL